LKKNYFISRTFSNYKKQPGTVGSDIITPSHSCQTANSSVNFTVNQP